jgi:hypothetical protein
MKFPLKLSFSYPLFFVKDDLRRLWEFVSFFFNCSINVRLKENQEDGQACLWNENQTQKL